MGSGRAAHQVQDDADESGSRPGRAIAYAGCPRIAVMIGGHGLNLCRGGQRDVHFRCEVHQWATIGMRPLRVRHASPGRCRTQALNADACRLFNGGRIVVRQSIRKPMRNVPLSLHHHRGQPFLAAHFSDGFFKCFRRSWRCLIHTSHFVAYYKVTYNHRRKLLCKISL